MTVPGALRWPLTLVLLAATLFHAVRLVTWLTTSGRGRPDHISEALHTATGAGMTAMAWPWSATIPTGLWITVFLPATLWFLHLAVGRPLRRTENVHFAVAAAAMAWMTLAMVPPGTDHAHPSTGTGHWHLSDPTPWWSTSTSALLGGYLTLATLWWMTRGAPLTPHWPTPQHSGVPLTGSHVDTDTHHPPPRTATPTRLADLCHSTMSAAMALMLLAPL